MIRRPPRSTPLYSSAASDVYKRQGEARTPFVYRNLGNMATIGRNKAIGDLGWIRIKGYFAWWFWLLLHIFWLIGFRNRLTVMTQWAFSYFTYQRSTRLITGDDERWDDSPAA